MPIYEKQEMEGTTMRPIFCKYWKKDCERKIVKERLSKNDCEREIVKERLWIRDCEREIVKERL